ncbi:hypothetical protein [Variovorax sp. N23]|uniref:hypothetical protein n=1 Tax=Variovorax sp. N23 TaxID=2980555 RepID=UPI0021C77D97|nr:hypothetical protein [Variovorax sp. N23]MCU4118872.1 hypothetical protein [Variovorax sp. N23]
MADEIPKSIELLVTGVVTLGTSFIGAYLAFLFNKLQHAKAVEERQVEACNAAMIVLARQYMLLRNFYDQHLLANRSSPGRHLQNGALLELKPSHSQVDIPSLTFLLDSEAQNLVLEFSVLDAKFHGCIDHINMRSLVHREQFQPALAAAVGESGATRLPGELIEKAIGDMLTMTLRRSTDIVYELVDDAMCALEAAGPSLQAKLKLVFPSHTIITFEPKAARTEPVGVEAPLPKYSQRPLYRDWP